MGQGSGVAMSYGVGHRYSSEPVLLWLWHRTAATAPIQPIAWELPYVLGAALKTLHSPPQKKFNQDILIVTGQVLSPEVAVKFDKYITK